jgi:hypothetical protein
MYRFTSKGKEKRGPVKVELRIGPVPGTDEGPAKLIIAALNTGDESVVLDGPGLRLPDNRDVILPMPLGRVRFPCIIHREEDCCVWTDAMIMAQNLHARGYSGKCPIVGYFNSGLGRSAVIFVSDPLEFNIDRLLENR